MKRLVLGASLACTALALAGAESGAPPAADVHASEDAKPVDTDAFTGVSIALHATDMLGPESGFRIRGWNSWGGGSKLLELAADGTEVKAGDVIARFDFQGKDAMSTITERIASAEARATQTKLSSHNTVEQLQLEKRKKEMDAKLAQIDVEKERALSKRQAEVYKITRKIADFEVNAIQQRIESAEREDAAESEYQDLVVARAKSDLDRYAFYERRFVIKAPHAGIVRHAFNGWERRKIQKGDQIQGGMKFMSIAKDKLIAARFFVPEARLKEIRIGTEVVVTAAGAADPHRAVVKEIEYFPQELGFLLENPNLPNAREKAFAVKAEFEDDPKELSAGSELVVKAAR